MIPAPAYSTCRAKPSRLVSARAAPQRETQGDPGRQGLDGRPVAGVRDLVTAGGWRSADAVAGPAAATRTVAGRVRTLAGSTARRDPVGQQPGARAQAVPRASGMRSSTVALVH
ncbi:hypothetical protein GCM10020219_075580 [Nonomuraea dietziae]